MQKLELINTQAQVSYVVLQELLLEDLLEEIVKPLQH